MAKLVIHQPNGTVREVKLDRDRVTIGRRADHDVCLPYPAVSADHAEIITVVADSFLHDVGSTNGTVVNGERVTKHFLRDHDRIDIARHQLVYLTNEDEFVEPLAPGVSGDEYSGASVPQTPAGVEEPDDEPVAAIEAATAAQLAPVDELLTDLMETESDASVAVDMPPTVSSVREAAEHAVAERAPVYAQSASGAYIEVMSGPNAGQITPMTKPEFVLGKAGASVAAIRRVDAGYRLVPLNENRVPTLNGQPVAPTGASLAFGDRIGVGGVVLRFNRREAL